MCTLIEVYLYYVSTFISVQNILMSFLICIVSNQEPPADKEVYLVFSQMNLIGSNK